MIEQSRHLGIQLDYIYHTTRMSGTLPGLIAAKLLTGNSGATSKSDQSQLIHIDLKTG